MLFLVFFFFFFQAEDGIRDAQESRGLGDVYKRQDPLLQMCHHRNKPRPAVRSIVTDVTLLACLLLWAAISHSVRANPSDVGPDPDVSGKRPNRSLQRRADIECGFNATTQCGPISDTQCSALCDFYQATGGPAWTNRQHWGDTDVDACSWHGVSCNGSHVANLSMAYNNLRGSLPSSVSGLTLLSYLNLQQTSLSGTLPSSISSLTCLDSLFLPHTSLSGTLPSSISSLTRLKFLFLPRTWLSGTLPSSISSLTSTSWLALGYTSLSGTLPSSISGLVNMQMMACLLYTSPSPRDS
eukprot:TRINITY_DN5807_c0_g1_i26.p1 TRINITY_DN5807_c0_g1~~TRINITY_DN5807_c0_g1_i26.p1  ORF type:complete len:297 (+),score=55.97 TRINITY_DN5807_c0_g1_i26:92-982(+)